MKKRIQILKISIFMGVLLLPSLIWYSVKFFAPKAYEKLDYDLGEKTEAEFPEKFNPRDYTQLLEAYYNANVPFRSKLISLQQKISGALESVYTDHLQRGLVLLLYGKTDDTSIDMASLLDEEVPAPDHIHMGTALYTQEADYTSYGYTQYRCDSCQEIYYDDFVGKLVDNSFLPPQIVGNNVLPGRHNWLFYAGDDSISYYRGTNILEQEQMDICMDLMVQLQDLCDEKGIQLQFMILPNKEQVYPEYMPSYTIEDNYKRTERFVDYVEEHSGIRIVYPLQELRQADIYWQTYHRYDTHWNHAGAFIGTQALYKALGISTTDLHELEVAQCPPTTSDLMILGGLDASQYPAEYDYEIGYRPDVTLTDIQGDMQPTSIYSAQSDCGNDINFVFIGDSFRCFMIDYLAKDFSHSVITYRETTDNRTDYPEEVVQSIRNADILVIEAVERYDSKLFPAIEKVIEILRDGDL